MWNDSYGRLGKYNPQVFLLHNNTIAYYTAT